VTKAEVKYALHYKEQRDKLAELGRQLLEFYGASSACEWTHSPILRYTPYRDGLKAAAEIIAEIDAEERDAGPKAPRCDGCCKFCGGQCHLDTYFCSAECHDDFWRWVNAKGVRP
jgi:hypothetical protein